MSSDDPLPMPRDRSGPTIAEFESLRIDPKKFDHEAHVYVAWSYLRQVDLLTSIERYRSALRRLTAKLGVPEKYHETMTWFYMVATAERAHGAAAADWDRFKTANPDLFQRGPSLIRRYYSEDRLMSQQARRGFVLPDLVPLR